MKNTLSIENTYLKITLSCLKIFDFHHLPPFPTEKKSKVTESILLILLIFSQSTYSYFQSFANYFMSIHASVSLYTSFSLPGILFTTSSNWRSLIISLHSFIQIVLTISVENELTYIIQNYISLLKCYKLFFSFKVLITMYHFLFILLFICLMFEGKEERRRGRGERKVGTGCQECACGLQKKRKWSEELTLDLRSEGQMGLTGQQGQMLGWVGAKRWSGRMCAPDQGNSRC